MEWFVLSVAIVGWLVGSLGIITLRGKHMSWGFALLLLLTATIGAGAVEFFMHIEFRDFVHKQTEEKRRSSARMLVAVMSSRLETRSDFIREDLLETADQPLANQEFDWIKTFTNTATLISEILAEIEGNRYLGDNYSVWLSDAKVRRTQLDQVATQIPKTQIGKPRRTTVESYLVMLTLTIQQLRQLASEID